MKSSISLMNKLYAVGFRLPIEALGSKFGSDFTSFSASYIPYYIDKITEHITIYEDWETLLINESILEENSEISDDHTILFRKKTPKSLDIPQVRLEHLYNGHSTLFDRLKNEYTHYQAIGFDFLSKSTSEVMRNLKLNKFIDPIFIPSEVVFAGSKFTTDKSCLILFAQVNTHYVKKPELELNAGGLFMPRKSSTIT